MEGTEVTGRCVLPPGHSPDLQLQVTAGPRVLAAWGPSPLVFAWTASEEDDDTKLVCEARMRAGNKPTKRSTPVGLSVTGGCAGGRLGGGGDVAAHFGGE